MITTLELLQCALLLLAILVLFASIIKALKRVFINSLTDFVRDIIKDDWVTEDIISKKISDETQYPINELKSYVNKKIKTIKK